jgi:hypothetical protein
VKDLFVYTADSDALSVMREVLNKREALATLGIGAFSFEIDKHAQRDSGMVASGPELLRYYKFKGNYGKIIAIWDYWGCGQEKKSPEICAADFQKRLDLVSWKDKSGAVVLVPALEEWFGHNTPSLLKVLKINEDELKKWTAEYIKINNEKLTPEIVWEKEPHKIFEYLFVRKYGHKPRPADFGELARLASVAEWMKSASFGRVISYLQKWFPLESKSK